MCCAPCPPCASCSSVTTRWGMRACSCSAKGSWTPSATWRSFSECDLPPRPPPALYLPVTLVLVEDLPWASPCLSVLAAGSFGEGALGDLQMVLLCDAGAVAQKLESGL